MQFIVLGVFTGILSGLMGIGGGIVMIPAMIYFFGFPQLAANGTSLIAMALPVGALGIWQYYRNGYIEPQHIKYGLLIGLGIFAGTFIGAKLTAYIPVKVLSKLFAALMVYAAVRLWVTNS